MNNIDCCCSGPLPSSESHTFTMAAPDARTGDVLSHGHLFGLKTDVKSNVHFVDEHLVVYPCGHSVVFLHVESRAQQVRMAIEFSCTHCARRGCCPCSVKTAQAVQQSISKPHGLERYRICTRCTYVCRAPLFLVSSPYNWYTAVLYRQ